MYLWEFLIQNIGISALVRNPFQKYILKKNHDIAQPAGK